MSAEKQVALFFTGLLKKFEPERFLDKDGSFRPDERVISFGIGRRQCPGQMSAEKQVALFFTGLLKKFELSKVDGAELGSYHLQDLGSIGLVRGPPAHEIIFRNRVHST